VKNFGKLVGQQTRFEEKNEDGELLWSQTVLALYDSEGTMWHELFRQHPHAFYAAVADDGSIVSFESDPEQCQIDGFVHLGLDQNWGLTPGSQGGRFSDKIWNGSEIVARAPTLRPLAKWRFEAMIDIIGQRHGVDLRGEIDTAIDALPEPNRTIARSKRNNVTDYERADTLFDFIGGAVSIPLTADQIDALWVEGQALTMTL
jgi:hypothetical protein